MSMDAPRMRSCTDYTALLRWCGRHHIDAVVVWGLLRDCHGGLESAKRLCDVAAKENVRLLCGVGLNAYGGVYYEGNSPYNLERHLEAHPELSAVDAEGNQLSFTIDANGTKTPITTKGMPGPRGFYQACPSRRENQDFMAESLAWLFKNLPLGGVQMETGDTGICQCKLCRDRRTALAVDILVALVGRHGADVPAGDERCSLGGSRRLDRVRDLFASRAVHRAGQARRDLAMAMPAWADCRAGEVSSRRLRPVGGRLFHDERRQSHHRGRPKDEFPALTIVT